jgi:hypothetical protein
VNATPYFARTKARYGFVHYLPDGPDRLTACGKDPADWRVWQTSWTDVDGAMMCRACSARASTRMLSHDGDNYRLSLHEKADYVSGRWLAPDDIRALYRAMRRACWSIVEDGIQSGRGAPRRVGDVAPRRTRAVGAHDPRVSR